MKKAMMVLVTAAMAATVAMANDVVSKNVVGFTSNSVIKTRYTMLGCQFYTVNGSTNIPIASLTNYPNPQTHDESFNGADNIRVWVPATASFVDYFRHTSLEWRKIVGGVPETNQTTDVMTPGQGFMFYKRINASGLTQLGEVLKENVVVPVSKGRYTMMCNPYPCSIPIASITNYPSPATHDESFNGADNIRVWVPATGAFVDYFRHTSLEWRKIVGGVPESSETTDQIDPGIGFMFYKRNTASQITFSSPIQ